MLEPYDNTRFSVGYEFNQNIGNAYMNQAVIDEENQTEISGVYHLDSWEAFHRESMGHGNRQELAEFIRNRSESSHKRAIVRAIEHYAEVIRNENQSWRGQFWQMIESLSKLFLPRSPEPPLQDAERSSEQAAPLLHFIWAGDFSGDGKKIQKEQLILNFIQSELDRSNIKQALFTKFWMRKHNVISQETHAKLYDEQNYGQPKSVNTRPYNEPVIKVLWANGEPDPPLDQKKFDVNGITMSIGDEIEELNQRIAEGRFSGDDLGRIKREPGFILFKPSIKKLFHTPKLTEEQIVKLNIDNYDESYVK